MKLSQLEVSIKCVDTETYFDEELIDSSMVINQTNKKQTKTVMSEWYCDWVIYNGGSFAC